MKAIYVFIFVFIFFSNLQSQQLANISSFYDNGFLWNPALTGRNNSFEVSATHEQEWVGFDDAPKYSTISLQYPFYKYAKSTQSSIGVSVDLDNIGPLQKIGFNGTYSYRFKPQLLGNKNDHLSIGFGVQIGKYQYDPSGLNGYDGLANDPTVSDEIKNSLSPNLNIGFNYISNTQYFNSKDLYYFGLSINQAIPNRISSLPLMHTALHSTLSAGYRFYIDKRTVSHIEPNIMAIYAFQKAFLAMFNVRYNVDDKWWLSVGIATNGEYFGQTGVILDEDSFIGGLLPGSQLLIGVKVDYTFGLFNAYRGVGYEGMVSFRKNLESK